MNKSLFDWFTETRFFTTQQVFNGFSFGAMFLGTFSSFLFFRIFSSEGLFISCLISSIYDLSFFLRMSFTTHWSDTLLYCSFTRGAPILVVAWFLLIPLLWSKMANCVLAYIPSYEKDSRFGQYFSSKLWNTSKFPLFKTGQEWYICKQFWVQHHAFQCTMSWTSSFQPFIRHFLMYTKSLMCTHCIFTKVMFTLQLWVLQTWWSKLTHFSFKRVALPSQVAHDHQKWLIMDFIHGCRSLLTFLLAIFVNCFLIPLARCQISSWWLMSVYFSFKNFLICKCLSVARLSIWISFNLNCSS